MLAHCKELNSPLERSAPNNKNIGGILNTHTHVYALQAVCPNLITKNLMDTAVAIPDPKCWQVLNKKPLAHMAVAGIDADHLVVL